MNNGAILVVDDTMESLKLLTDILSAEGYHVRPADSGQLALASIAVRPPDLILLDIRMPEMDGFEVCRRVRSSSATRDIPIIFISATPEVDERVEGLRLGAVDFITKPYQREELCARVKTHLELSRLRSQLEQLVAARTADLNDANEKLRHAAHQQRRFLRDMLASVTDGTLLLCHDDADLPVPLAPYGAPIFLSATSGLWALRKCARDAADYIGMSGERGADVVTAAHEAGMNSVVHAGNGVAQVFTAAEIEKVQVRIDDSGPGISLDNLPQATLQKGFTTAGTLGHGMKMMLSLADRVFLRTGPTGTTIVLEQNAKKPVGIFR
ncbi:MAG: response regulator [Capsulimonas sp.]|uniref:response regulator n=1 Tax=Capsulimonas sp. TaxID=2494211 RepID=UPI003265A4DD